MSEEWEQELDLEMILLLIITHIYSATLSFLSFLQPLE